MGKRLMAKFLLTAMLSFAVQPTQAAGSKSRLMFMTSAYGVMLGALSGLATLAFYEHPGEKTRNVALGASLGLYTGIVLGTYMIYVRPDPNAPPEPPAEEEDALLRRPGLGIPEPQIYANDYLLAPQFGVSRDGRTPTVGLVLNF